MRSHSVYRLRLLILALLLVLPLSSHAQGCSLCKDTTAGSAPRVRQSLRRAILILSSLTMEMARRQLFREIDVMDEWLGLGRPAVKRAAPWLIATLVLGSLFLAGQWIAWEQLVQQGFYFNSPDPSSHFFYLITGVHGLHLLLGIVALAGALAAMFILRRIELRQIVVDCTAWYWHTMGLFWIFLFGLLAFFQ